MQLAATQLAHHLQKGLRPLYTLHGDEALLVQEAADAIRAAARAQGFSERTVHAVAGARFDWSAVLAAGPHPNPLPKGEGVKPRLGPRARGTGLHRPLGASPLAQQRGEGAASDSGGSCLYSRQPPHHLLHDVALQVLVQHERLLLL